MRMQTRKGGFSVGSFARRWWLPLCCLVGGWVGGWLAGDISGKLTLQQAIQGQVLLSEASGDIENTGHRYLALLTRTREFLPLKGEWMESPEGDVFLHVYRVFGRRLERHTMRYLGTGATGKLMLRDLTNDGSTELFVFADGQGTLAYVMRFSGKVCEDLFTKGRGRPQVSCRKARDGKWEILEDGRLDWYDDVPDHVSQKAKRMALAKPGTVLPLVRRVHRWSKTSERFVLDRIEARPVFRT